MSTRKPNKTKPTIRLNRKFSRSPPSDPPPLIKPKSVNVILFNETGDRNSSVINLIAQRHVAKVSSDIQVTGSPMASTPYNISFDDINFTIFDTVGLAWPGMEDSDYLEALENGYKLIRKLEAAGGVHLLLFCMHAGRMTATTQRNYRIFYECLCRKRVPIALVITGLEREDDPEDWWRRNEDHILRCGIEGQGHACITTVHDPEERVNYESQVKLRNLLEGCALKTSAPLPESHPWLIEFAKETMSSIMRCSMDPKREELMRTGIQRCNLLQDTAEMVTNMVGESAPEPNGHGTEPAGEKEGRGGLFPKTNRDNDKVASNPTRRAVTLDSIPLPQPHSTSEEPDIRIGNVALDLWKHDELEKTEERLSEENAAHEDPSHVLACRALVRTRLQQCEAAIEDAKQSIRIQPSALGYIAMSVALVRKGERDKGYRMSDIAFAHFHSAHVSFLLLVKAVIIFMVGDHSDAISRVDDLITSTRSKPLCYVVQAYMYLLLGDSQMKRKDYLGAIKSFGLARDRMKHCGSELPVVISLISGWKFDHLEIRIQQRCCEALYALDRTTEAVQLLLQMLNTSGEATHINKSTANWVSEFKLRCCEKLEYFGDLTMERKEHDKAIANYSTALSLNLAHQGLLIKRSKAWMAKKSWDDALNDVNEVIAHDTSSPWGYEAKHAVLHEAKRYPDAVIAFETMFSKMVQSLDPNIRNHCNQYEPPSDVRTIIQGIVKRITDHLPRVLIHTSTGRLQNRAEQVSTFESSPIFYELLSSMTTRIDSRLIERKVKRYFRYVMLSHRWQENEPLFQDVKDIVVYDLDESPTHDKLKKFCKTVQDSGSNWAWSDTCCIDKRDQVVRQEALVAMFKWYRSAAMVVVYLLGVRPESGDLARSTWNTRAWTFQEYIAAQVVRFYMEDWTLYRQLEATNHKESPEIITEMEEATGVSAQRLRALRPGLCNIREKLYLASRRETTKVEDSAYSLLGIFSVTGIIPNYGERESALGRLLRYLLFSSGDVSILAWTGNPGNVNSCLPASITVYSQPEASYLPTPIKDTEMDETLTRTHHATPNLELARRFYARLNKLDMASFEADRLQLPCIAFKLPSLSISPSDKRSNHVYCSETSTFGTVEIKTKQDLSQHLNTLYLLHPWLDALLGREHAHVGSLAGNDAVEPPSLVGVDDEDQDDQDNGEDRDGSDSSSIPEIKQPPQLDEDTRVLQLIARLRQPFGALLFTHMMTRGEKKFGKRVAADCMITVQISENVALEELLDNVDALNIV